MAIVKLDKMTLYGPMSQKEQILKSLQEFGCVHLTDLEQGKSQVSEFQPVLSKSHKALEFLKSSSLQRNQAARPAEFDRKEIVDQALEIQNQQRELTDESLTLKKEIHELEPWGDFQAPENNEIAGIQFWFYAIPLRDRSELENLDYIHREISSDQINSYVVILSKTEPDNVPGNLLQLPDQPLSALKKRQSEVEKELEHLQFQHADLTRWISLLQEELDMADDRALRKFISQHTYSQSEVFVLQGWVPRIAKSDILNYIKNQPIAVTFQPPGPEDQPPTLLQNPERVAGGEGLVTFYKTPDYRAWDPSAIAFISFALFFAMILADAGYAILLGVGLGLFWKKLGATVEGRRGRVVLSTVIGFSLIYGIIVGSYFGFAPSKESLLGKLMILDAQSSDVMMPISILIGVAHIALANLSNAWLYRGHRKSFGPLGWVLVLVGGTFYGVGMMLLNEQAILMTLGAIMFILGLVFVFFFTSERPFRTLNIKTHLLRIFDGIVGLTEISGLFGDVLSYLRLFALGLSSAKLAETFNSLASDVWGSAGLGMLFAIVILFLGHSLNLLLGIMGGVVHGMRLNCIEFFKWGLPDEGHPFKAFEKKAR